MGIIEKEESVIATYSENSGCSSLSVPIVLSGIIVNQEQVLALHHSTEPTEPVVIPEPARWLEDANERIVPLAIRAVQHSYQRPVLGPDDTDSVMRLLHFIHTLVHGNLKKTLRQVRGR